MKKKKLLYTLLAILILAALIPTAYAFMFRKSQTIDNLFQPAAVSCEVEENMARSDSGDAKTSVKVQNTGNVEAYIKVQLIFYWQDSKGVAVGRDAPIPNSFFQNYIRSADWIDGGNFIYYYKHPVAPGNETEQLLQKPIELTPVNEPNSGVDYIYYPVVEIIAEAIQSVPEEQIEQSWGITIEDSEIIRKGAPGNSGS